VAYEVPTFVDQSDYTLTTALDGATYSLRLRWSERGECWLLTLTTAAGEPVIQARPCVGGVPLIAGLAPLAPPGQLTIIGGDPRRYDWGARSKLVYLTAADMAALP
jgi:hypothetical protein